MQAKRGVFALLIVLSVFLSAALPLPGILPADPASPAAQETQPPQWWCRRFEGGNRELCLALLQWLDDHDGANRLGKVGADYDSCRLSKGYYETCCTLWPDGSDCQRPTATPKPTQTSSPPDTPTPLPSPTETTRPPETPTQTMSSPDTPTGTPLTPSPGTTATPDLATQPAITETIQPTASITPAATLASPTPSPAITASVTEGPRVTVLPPGSPPSTGGGVALQLPVTGEAGPDYDPLLDWLPALAVALLLGWIAGRCLLKVRRK